MNRFLKYIALGLILISCNINKNEVKGAQDKSEEIRGRLKIDSLILKTPPLKLDHVFILIDSTNNVHQKLVEAGLTSAEDWKTPHEQQGTTGEFFFFLNFYFEFLYISNIDEATNNIENFGSDYVQRSKWTDSNYFPFGLGLILNDSTKEIPFDTHTYKAKWMREENVLKMAKSSEDLKEPIAFVEPSDWANKIFENTEQLISKANPEVRKYRQNDLGIESLTKVILNIPKEKEQFSQTLKELEELNNVEVQASNKPLLILEFDDKRQKKELDFEKELRLKIKY